MAAPPGAAPAAGAHLNQQGGNAKAMTPAQRVSTLMKQARSYRQLDTLSNTRLSTLVNEYVSSGVQRDFESWVFAYADPTARQAIRNVTRERGY